MGMRKNIFIAFLTVALIGSGSTALVANAAVEAKPKNTEGFSSPFVSSTLWESRIPIASKLPTLKSLKIKQTVGKVAAPPPDSSGNGPWTVRVVIRSSKDGVNFSGRDVIMDQAGVPNLLFTSQGQQFAYFQDWANGNIISVATRKSSSKPWTRYKIHVEGMNLVSKPNGVDPSAVELPDGRIRIYWMQRSGGNRIFSATSSKGASNGIIFKFDGKYAFDYSAEIFDPTVVKTKSGWALWVDSLGTPVYATSDKNGLRFSLQSGNPAFSNAKSFPWGAVSMPNGEIRVLGSINGPGGGEGYIFKSLDGGKTFTQLAEGTLPSNAGGDAALGYDATSKTWYQMVSERMD